MNILFVSKQTAIDKIELRGRCISETHKGFQVFLAKKPS